MKKYMTIVIAYEGEEMPIKGFGVPVLGCEVTAMSVGDLVNDKWLLDQAIEDTISEDGIQDIKIRIEEIKLGEDE